MKTLLSTIIIVAFFTSFARAETITVEGNTFLRNQRGHDNIKVVFERIAPSSLIDSTFTNISGYLSIEIETGVYNITYSKEGYFKKSIELSMYSDTTLGDLTLSTMLEVPSAFPTIQLAINAASSSDTVLVSPGIYSGFHFHGENITVGSLFLTTLDTAYISDTIIHEYHVMFENHEDSTSLFSGFTIKNIRGYNQGGGIYCEDSNPKLSNINIIDNDANEGGGIFCYNSSPIINNVNIFGNTARLGGGIFCSHGSKPIISNVNIIDNSSNYGGGIYCTFSSPILTNVNIINNKANEFGGGFYCQVNNPKLVNCIISNNSNYGFYVESGTPSISFSNLWDNLGGNFYNPGEWIGKNVTINANGDSCDAFYNIQLDPSFVDPDTGDYHLSADSPCIGAGIADDAPEYDFEGILRGTPPDIGAYENNLNAPNQPPTIITTSLPNANEDNPYEYNILVEDPNEDDSYTFEIITAPDWLSIDPDTGRLSGTPENDDVGTDIEVMIKATDIGGLSDELTTTINVINVNDPPEILTSSLPNAMEGKIYSVIIEAIDPDENDSTYFKIIEAPQWLTIDDTGTIKGTPLHDDINEGIAVIITIEDIDGLADTLSTVLTVHYNPVLGTNIAFDHIFQNAGYQGGGEIIDNPGPGERFGFAVYLKNNIVIRGFTIDLTWDAAKASYRTSQSGPGISDEIYDINGRSDVEFAEETNILLSDDTGSMSSIVGADEEGHYKVSWAKMGGEPVTNPEGLLYLAVFKTADDFSEDDWLTISVNVTVSDDKGNEYPLQGKEFTVGSEIAPPSNVTVTDIPGDQGHGMEITWTLSPDDAAISYYNIYRSRFPDFTDPLTLESFITLDELIAAEQNSTILIESVPRGETAYLDMTVPVSNVEYYYWLQAISENGASEKVAAGNVITSVEAMPAGQRLHVPYPNPFNPTTTIDYYLSQDTSVTLEIYNISGQKVAVLKDGIIEPGYHSIVWNASGMPSGIYFCRLTTNDFVDMKKMLLLK